MKIILMGTGPFAVPTFRWLFESGHEIIALVTRPIDDPGKRRKSAANPVLDLARERGFQTILDPANVNEEAMIGKLRDLAADLMVVCDYGQILGKETLAVTQLGGINLHGSMLPKYRGAAPIQWAVLIGEKETGVSVIHMTSRLDGGPVIVQRSLAIGDDETAAELEPRLAALGVEAVAEAISLLEKCNGTGAPGVSQDRALATRAPRLQKEQGNIDWNRPARELFNQIRAFQPWPGSFAFLQTTISAANRAEPLRLIVLKARALKSPAERAAGTVVGVAEDSLCVATGDGVLEILEIQPAGKRAMPVSEFLRGHKVAPGDQFVSQEMAGPNKS
jgi:methionyl-tRNA formyltransferase